MLDGTDGAHHGVELQVLRHLVLAAYTGGIDEIEVKAKLVKPCVDTVAGGAGNLGDDVAVFADEGIDDAALAGIGAAYDGKAGDIVFHILLGLQGQTVEDGVEQVARTATGGGADAEGIAQTEAVELGSLIVFGTVVYLVSHKDYGQLGTAQDERHILVPVGETGLDIYQEEHQIGLFGGDEHLLADGVLEDVVRVDYPSTGIDYRKFFSIP